MTAATSKERARVVVVGSANMDLVAFTPRAPERGETVIGDRFESGFGGKGANQAVMAHLTGADVTFVGALGDDDTGRVTREHLVRLGLSDRWVAEVTGTSSGIAQIWVEPDGANRIVIIAGANAAVDPGQAAAAIGAVRPAVVVAQLEIPQAVSAEAFRAARLLGSTTVLNPAPAAELRDDLLALTDWLVPNETEFTRLSDGGDAHDDVDLLDYARRIDLQLIVTMGAAGVALVEPDRVVRIGASHVTAVDTTGAGDAFVGAFAAGLALGHDPRTAIEVASHLAADSVTRRGAQGSFPSQDRVAELIAGVTSSGADQRNQPR
jgi:ribokinase